MMLDGRMSRSYGQRLLRLCQGTKEGFHWANGVWVLIEYNVKGYPQHGYYPAGREEIAEYYATKGGKNVNV